MSKNSYVPIGLEEHREHPSGPESSFLENAGFRCRTKRNHGPGKPWDGLLFDFNLVAPLENRTKSITKHKHKSWPSWTPRVTGDHRSTVPSDTSPKASRRSLRRLRCVPALIASCCARTAPPPLVPLPRSLLALLTPSFRTPYPRTPREPSGPSSSLPRRPLLFYLPRRHRRHCHAPRRINAVVSWNKT